MTAANLNYAVKPHHITFYLKLQSQTSTSSGYSKKTKIRDGMDHNGGDDDDRICDTACNNDGDDV
jgi:hypothetical protein